jgi:TatD DNase family protein
MIDSHCHLDVDAFAADREATLARALDAGVEEIVIPAVDERSWLPILALAWRQGRPRCRAALGIHPVALPDMDPGDDVGVLSRLLSRAGHERIVAVGECGLDTTIDLNRAPLSRQEQVLRAQLEIARTLKLPLILHARGPGAYPGILSLLRAEPPGWSGVLHSYGGGAELLRDFLRLPLWFGFAGPATYPNARRIRAAIQSVPADRLLAETDAPDQAPEPHRPGRSEPAYVADVIRGLASARGVSAAEIEEITTRNARQLFPVHG